MTILDPRWCEIEWLRGFVRDTLSEPGLALRSLDKLTSGDVAKLVKAIQAICTAGMGPDRDF